MQRGAMWAGIAFVAIVAATLGVGLLVERTGDTTRAIDNTSTTNASVDTTAPATVAVRPTVPPGLVDLSVPADGALPGQAESIEVASNEGEHIGSIDIPRLGLVHYIYEGVQLTTLDLGPGHWPGTAMPGEDGNVVLAGHRTSMNAAFAGLDQLEPGDEVFLQTPDGTFTYDVETTEIVEPSALWIAEQTDEPTATLFACHPPGSVSQRIVVRLSLAT